MVNKQEGYKNRYKQSINIDQFEYNHSHSDLNRDNNSENQPSNNVVPFIEPQQRESQNIANENINNDQIIDNSSQSSLPSSLNIVNDSVNKQSNHGVYVMEPKQTELQFINNDQHKDNEYCAKCNTPNTTNKKKVSVRKRYSIQEEDALVQKFLSYYPDSTEIKPDGNKMCTEMNINPTTLERIRVKAMDCKGVVFAKPVFSQSNELKVSKTSQVVIPKITIDELKNTEGDLLARNIFLVDDRISIELDSQGRLILTNLSYIERNMVRG